MLVHPLGWQGGLEVTASRGQRVPGGISLRCLQQREWGGTWEERLRSAPGAVRLLPRDSAASCKTVRAASQGTFSCRRELATKRGYWPVWDLN